MKAKTTGTRVALYARVSTGEQTAENQLRDLRKAAELHGWHIVGEYVDEGVSGAKGRDKRPALDGLCKAVARRQCDKVAAWSTDRIGRSLAHLVEFLAELQAKGCGLYLHRQALDTDTPAGKALFQMLGVFAEFERALIVERVNAGIARARAQGTKSGRPLGRPKAGREVEERIRELYAQGIGRVKIARTLGVGVGLTGRVLGR